MCKLREVRKLAACATTEGCHSSHTVTLTVRAFARRLILIAVYFDNSVGKCPRGFLRQIVSDPTHDGPVLVSAREFLGVGAGLRMWCAVGITFKRNGRHGDDREFGKPLFQIVVFRLAFCQTESPAIIMNHDGDVIGVVKRHCAAIKRGAVEDPFWRSDLPNEL